MRRKSFHFLGADAPFHLYTFELVYEDFGWDVDSIHDAFYFQVQELLEFLVGSEAARVMGEFDRAMVRLVWNESLIV